MNWRELLPSNKYVYAGLIVTIFGFLTIPYLIGLILMPLGLLALAYGLRKNYYELAKRIGDKWKKIKKRYRK